MVVTQQEADFINSFLGLDLTIDDYELISYVLDTDFLKRVSAIVSIKSSQSKEEKTNARNK